MRERLVTKNKYDRTFSCRRTTHAQEIARNTERKKRKKLNVRFLFNALSSYYFFHKHVYRSGEHHVGERGPAYLLRQQGVALANGEMSQQTYATTQRDAHAALGVGECREPAYTSRQQGVALANGEMSQQTYKTTQRDANAAIGVASSTPPPHMSAIVDANAAIGVASSKPPPHMSAMVDANAAIGVASSTPPPHMLAERSAHAY